MEGAKITDMSSMDDTNPKPDDDSTQNASIIIEPKDTSPKRDEISPEKEEKPKVASADTNASTEALVSSSQDSSVVKTSTTYGVPTKNSQATPRPSRQSSPKLSTTHRYNTRSRLSRKSGILNGLKNHGNTCYLNSLIQSLYLTHEFRDAVWAWMPASLKSRSLAKALQTVFIDLKTKDEAAPTRDFFTCNQWKINDLLEQMDIQELKAELFDKLESNLKSTGGFVEIERAFTGSLTHIVKCLQCKNISSREENFHDISLALRRENSMSSVESLEEALEMFTKPELLDGENQYFCDKCQAKADGLKGISFKTVPPVFCILLKRFDYNSTTNTKLKNNDRITFPFTLNVDALYETTRAQWKEHVDENASYDFCGAEGSKEDEDEKSQDSNKKKPNLYELYSVLIHGGTTCGGHYYAFIKSVETKNWYKFDDAIVETATEDHVRTAFGGCKFAKRESAYMLWYRKVSEEKVLIESSKLPPTIEEFLADEANRKHINFYYTDTHHKLAFDVNAKKYVKWKTSTSPRGITVGEAFNTCRNDFSLHSTNLFSYRMVIFDPETSFVKRSLDNDDEILEPKNDHINIWVQAGSFDEKFVPCPIEQISPFAILLQPNDGAIEKVKNIPVEITLSIEEFRDKIASAFEVADASALQLIMDALDQPIQTLTVDGTPLQELLRQSPVARFYVAPGTTDVKEFDTFLHEKIMKLRITSQIYTILPPYRPHVDGESFEEDDNDDYLFSCCDEELSKPEGLRRVIVTIHHLGPLKWLRLKFGQLLNSKRESESIILRTTKCINSFEEEDIVGSFVSLKKALDPKDLLCPDFQLRVYIQDELAKIPCQVYYLDIGNLNNPLSCLVSVDVNRAVTVGAIKREVVEKMFETHKIDLVLDKCRLRMLEAGRVAKILHDRENIQIYQNAEDPGEAPKTMHMCLQVVAEKDKLFSMFHDAIFIFVQSYDPVNKTLGRVDEFFLASGSSNEFTCKLKELTQMQEDELQVMLAPNKFPSAINPDRHSRSAIWYPLTNISDWWGARVYTDGHLLFYRNTFSRGINQVEALQEREEKRESCPQEIAAEGEGVLHATASERPSQALIA